MRELFPELKDEDFPFKAKVEHEKVYYLTDSGSMRIPTPPTMKNKGNYIASLAEVVRWLGSKCEELGINLFTSFPADSLMTEGNKIKGVRTAPAGLGRDGSPKDQYMPPTDVVADVTVLAEGTRGALTQAYLEWQNITSKIPQIYALGVKELWKTKNVPDHIIHTMGWPLPKTAFGGSFLYPMEEDLVSLGLVVGLDYREHNLDVHNLLQQMKLHPLFKSILEGGELQEWGAKTIPEGGFYALPQKLHGDGLLILGDAAGMVNVPALKGIHYAMQSGILAARTIFDALKKKDFSADTLKAYDEKVAGSLIHKELYKVRGMRHAFKSGFFMGGLKAGLMTITGGAFPGIGSNHLSDSAEPKDIVPDKAPPKEGVDKTEGVFQAGNKTRDDIPSHLTVGEDIPADVAEMYVHMCPASVYERNGDELVVNAPNCVDCKATDVLGPRWQPREGGSGPDYKKM
jgi:electron-transferring-flavoprotein dehydrogenase